MKATDKTTKKKHRKAEQTEPKHVNFETKRFWTILLVILLVGLGTKLIRLDQPKDFYFDEVYHGFTAGYYLDGNREAYNMYYKNPPGRAVEWTHPPLAKLIMAGAMAIVGPDSFGWRFSSTIFGTLLALFAALLAFELFGSHVIALFTAFLISIEGLLFTQARIAMNDSHVMAFIFLSLYFFVRWRKNPDNWKLLFFAGAAQGLALSCKWSALFVYFILTLDRVFAWWKEGNIFPSFKEFRNLILAFIVVPIAIYLLSYAHFFSFGYTWDEFVHLQKGMWWYHTHLTAKHGYQSVPYQWLFNIRPVWMYVDYSVPEYIGNIYNLGNTVILYLGLASVVLAIQELRKQQWSWQVWFCLASYFMVWVPWMFSPRIMLFYHYAPAVPMLCILLSRNLELWWIQGQKKAVYGVTAAAVIWFAVFYPNSTALPVPKWFADKVYFLIPSWK
jgi:dolichyl-phosphate-mannose-protein mannosyltransferase